MAKKHEHAEDQEEARVRVAADQGIASPAPGDGVNVGDTHPQPGPEPGVTEVPHGDEDVPAFIPDEVGPRTEADERREASVEERAEEAARPSVRAEHSRARAQAEREAPAPERPAGPVRGTERHGKGHEA